MRIFCSATYFFASLFFLSSAANAVLVSYNFSGALSSVSDTGNLLGGDFSVGDTFAGTFSYESDSVDGSSSPTYFTSPADVSISAQLNTYDFGSSIASVDLNSDVHYIFFIAGFSSDPFIDLGTNPGRLMTIFLKDDTGAVFQDDALPTSLDFNDFSEATFRLFGDTGPGGATFTMLGSISSLTLPSAVPEPTTLAIFGIGLAGLAGMRRRRKAA